MFLNFFIMKFLILLLILMTNCKKVDPDIPCIDECISGNYTDYSTDNYDYVKTHLVGQSLIGPSFQYLEDYSYGYVVFNPNNHFEFAYAKTNIQTYLSEIWKFSFCTGKATKIADNFNYNLDWGSNGWLLYTGTDHKIYKVKDNGDSLTVLSTQGGFNRAGKWNPSGSMYWNYRDDGFYLEYPNGNTYKKISPSGALNWINDSTLLVSLGLKLNSFLINSNIFTELNSNQATPNSVIFNKGKMTCYIPFQNGTGQDDYFVKYDLNGSNSVDTIKSLYDSYYYVTGDIVNDKIITQLRRQHWIDSLADSRYIRENIVIMDLEGNNERLVDLP